MRVHIVCEKHLSVRTRRKSLSARLWVSWAAADSMPVRANFQVEGAYRTRCVPLNLIECRTECDTLFPMTTIPGSTGLFGWGNQPGEGGEAAASAPTPLRTGPERVRHMRPARERAMCARGQPRRGRCERTNATQDRP